MTPITEVQKFRTLRTGRLEVWFARSADGVWTYERIEDADTPWQVTHVPTGRWFLIGSLPRARKLTGSGAALHYLERSD